MMNVLTDILCDTSSMMAPPSYNVVMPQNDMMQHDISSDHGPMHLLESVSQMSSLESSLTHSSPSEINLFESASQIHIPSNLDSGFEERSSVSVFSDSFPEIVPSWLTHDFMKASDNLGSPNLLPNVTDIYSNREPNHLEMLDLGFHSDLTTHNVSNSLNSNCDVNSQKILEELPMQRYSNTDSLIIPHFNMNNSEFHISMSKSDLQEHTFKQNDTSLDNSQSLMNSILPCDNELLNLPLPSNLTEQCLSSSSPSLISNSQSQSHVVCDKLQISLNHLDSLLGNEPSLSDIQLLRNNFTDVHLGTNNSGSHRAVENYHPNGNVVQNMTATDLPRLSHSKDVAIQASCESPTFNSSYPNLNCFSCSQVDPGISMDIVQCFKCKFCDYISLHKCSIENHINASHSKTMPLNIGNVSSLNVGQISESANSIIQGSGESHFVNEKVSQESVNIIDLKEKNSGLRQPDQAQKSSNITALKHKKILPKKTKADEIPQVSKINQRKMLPKNPESDNLSKNTIQKKSTNEKNSKKNLSSHKKAWKRKINRELGSYICEAKGCNVRFQAIDNLEYHKKCHGDGIKKFVCPECSTTFLNWGATAGHLWRQHGNDMELHKCDQCPFRTFSLSRLENIHKKIHGDECLFLCDTCGKNFKNIKQLRNHKVRHTKLKPKEDKPRCSTCNIYFANKKTCRRHEKTAHLKINPFVCKYCDYNTSKKESLELHMRSHTGEKPYKCDECNYCSADHNTLRRHKMKHSGYKPYKCPLCSYSCNQANRFKDHLCTVHPYQNTGLIFSCNVCSFKTISQDIYNKHMTGHQNRLQGENFTPELPSIDDIFPLAEAMDISLSNANLSNFNKHKNIQSFLNNLNANMVIVGHERVN